MVSHQDRIFEIMNKSPGPGRYNLNRAMIKKKPYQMKGPLSSFAGTVLQHKINLRDPIDMKKQVELDLIGKKKITMDDLKVPGPGPGEYGYMESFAFMKDYKPENNRGEKWSIVDDRDRFGNNQEFKTFVQPGPGAYELDKDVGVNKEKAMVSGSVFLSESERVPYGKLSDVVAPNKYVPQNIPEQISFHFNVANKWV